MPLNESDNSSSNDKNTCIVERRYLPCGRINIENKSEILSVRATAVQWSQAAARHLPIYRREPLLTLALISIGFPKLLFGPELDSFWYDDVLSSGRFSGRSGLLLL